MIGTADTLVKADAEYSDLVQYLLGRVLVVDHIDHAIAIGKKYRHSLRMVTIEGESLSPGGSMTGGAFRNNSNLLGRRREIEELEKNVELRKQELEAAQQSVLTDREQRNKFRDRISELQQRLRQQYVEQNTAKLNLEQLQKKEEEIQKTYRQIDRDQDELRRQALEIREDHQNIAKELEASQKDEKELETFIETKQKELDEWKEEETARQKKLEQIRLDCASLEQQKHFLQENLNRLETEIQACETESEELLTDISQSGDEIVKKENGIQNLRREMEACEKKDQELYTLREKCEAEKEERTGSHKAFFEKRDHLSEKTTLLDKECFRLRSQAEKVEEQRESRIAYMWEEYEITPNNALSYKKEELDDFQEIRKDVSRTKKKSADLVPSMSMRLRIIRNFWNVTPF